LRVDGFELGAPWLLLWFEGARNWKDFDVPWLLVLQHPPTRVEITNQGLKMVFADEVGYVGSMPFYGDWKCPLKDSRWVNNQGRKKVGVKTWLWKNGLPDNVVKRADWWSSHIRKFPIYAKEEFAIDGDNVKVRTRFQYLETEDKWGTKQISFAPLPHVLGMALDRKWEVVNVKQKIHDPFLVTSWGPYMGVLGSQHDVTYQSILKYIHEKEVYTKPTSGLGKEALERLREWYKNRLYYGDQYWPPWGMDNLVWSTSGADFIIPKLIDYVARHTREKAIRKFDPWMQNYLLTDSFEHGGKTYKFWLKQKVGNKEYFYINGPGIGGDAFGDGGKLANNTLYTFWCYGHYMDRWDNLRVNWDKIKRTMLTPLNMNWKTLGREAIAEMGDECQPVMAAARMAYRIGDADLYAYACYIFARQATHHYLKSIGGEYLRKYQPIHHLKELPYPWYLTNLLGHTMGWSSGGLGLGSTQWTNRFVRFNDEDIGRMHHDYLWKFHKWELDHLDELWAPFLNGNGSTVIYTNDWDRSHINPGVPRIRGFILDEKIDQLVKYAKLDEIREDSGYPLALFAYIRSSVPRKHVRLISYKGNKTPYVLGKERDAGSFSPFTVQFGRFTKYWPVATWYCPPSWSVKSHGGFPNPKAYYDYGTGNDRSFGAIKPGDQVWPKKVMVNRMNWNTQVMSWEISDKSPLNLAHRDNGSEARVMDIENNFYQPWRLIDGSLTSQWSSKRLKKEKKERWIEIEFPQIETVAVLSIHGGREIKKIDISTNSKIYKEVKAKAIEQRTEIRFDPPFKAKIIRVTFTAARHVMVSEVEAYGPDEY